MSNLGAARNPVRPIRGVMKRQLQVLNHRREVMQDAVQAFLLKRKTTQEP